MRIVIIGAMEREITFLLSKIGNYKRIKHYKYDFYEGKLFDHEVIVTASGIGKVASGLLVSAIVNYYKNIDLIINVGVSGGIKNQVNIGDVVVASSLRYADSDVTIFNYEYGQMPNCPIAFPTIISNFKKLPINLPYKVGTIITGDQFYHEEDKVNELLTNYFKDDNVLCIDMESTALAHSAWLYDIDYLAIRSISDVIGSGEQKNDYNKNLDLACDNSNLFLLEVLKNI